MVFKGLPSISLDMWSTGDFFIKSVEETWWGKIKLLKIKAYSAEAILSQVCLAGAAAAAALFVLWPANSGSGWGFQHPSCQRWGAKPGNAGSSLSVRHWVSQPHWQRCRQFNTKASSGWEYQGLHCWGGGKHRHCECGSTRCQGLSFNWLSRWINSSLLPRNLASPPLSRVVSPLSSCLSRTW